MSVKVRELRLEDIDPVVDGLWERGVREAARFGFCNYDELRSEIALLVGEKHAYTIEVHGVPIVILGASEIEPRHFRTFFLATDSFLASGVTLTRLLRRFISEKVSEEKPSRLDVLSACDHPAAAKWFQRLGFIPRQEHNGFTLYLYAPN